MTSHEEWRDISGWEGSYQVFSLGRVRSLDRVVTQVSRWGIQNRVMVGKILKPGYCRNGYQSVTLSRPGEKQKIILVHRLVASSFHGEPGPGQEVCHINGVRDDNRKDNLRWDSRSSNHADKVLHGTDARGEKNPMSKLTPKEVIEIRKSHLTLKELSKVYGVTEGTLSEIRNRKSWSWLEES